MSHPARRLPGGACALAAIGLLAASPPAEALWRGHIQPFVAESITHDDNVFRLSGALDPEAILGSPTTADTYRTMSFGLSFDIPVSAQRFVGRLTTARQRFGRFSNLDLNGHTEEAYWLWRAGERASGRVGYSQSLVLASFANLQNGFASTVPNFLRRSETRAGARYDLAARWRVNAELTRRRDVNSAQAFRVSNADIDGLSLTSSYVTAAGSKIGVNVRSVRGRLPQPQLIGGIAIDNSYTQRSVSAVLDWQITAASHLHGRLGPFSRRYADLPGRGIRDWSLDAVYDWSPTDEVKIRTSLQRGISETEQVDVGFVFVEQISLEPVWQLTDEISLGLELQRGRRTYRGYPGTADALGSAASVSERVSTAAMTVSYRPTRRLRVRFALRHEHRSSPVPAAAYGAQIVSVELRAAF